MENLDYSKLYELQDKVLDIVFETENIFYLTGGTCLSRFYQEKRYSDDLDFFTHDTNSFNRALKEIKVALSKQYKVIEEVTSKDFVRIKVDELLQIDFVNDRVMRYKEIVLLDNGYRIDNCENILANKITAVMGRDNPKDIFDIFLIDKFYSFDYEEILKVAHEKSGFNNDDLIVRLKTFPRFLLENISLVDSSFLDNFEVEYEKIIQKIEEII